MVFTLCSDVEVEGVAEPQQKEREQKKKKERTSA
jgi:hypothetical protein